MIRKEGSSLDGIEVDAQEVKQDVELLTYLLHHNFFEHKFVLEYHFNAFRDLHNVQIGSYIAVFQLPDIDFQRIEDRHSRKTNTCVIHNVLNFLITMLSGRLIVAT